MAKRVPLFQELADLRRAALALYATLKHEKAHETHWEALRIALHLPVGAIPGALDPASQA